MGERGEKGGGLEVMSKRASVRHRHEEMVKMVQETGYATIQDMADRFGVTPQTIRRDINQLSDQGVLQRYHGGASITVSTENVDYSNRKVLYQAEKTRIGELTAQHIPDRTSVFINIGTTTEAVARALLHHKGLRVITNNLNVGYTLSGNEHSDVYLSGGLIRHRDRGIVGEASMDFIGQFKADIGIIGISGIDMDGTLLDFDYREVRAARAIIDNSRKVFLVTDHSKFGRNAMVRLGGLDEIDAIFTDKEPPESIMRMLERNDVQLYVADSPEMVDGNE